MGRKIIDIGMGSYLKYQPVTGTLSVINDFAIFFFSYYDPYRGVVVYFRVVDGTIKKGDRVYFMASKKVK